MSDDKENVFELLQKILHEERHAGIALKKGDGTLVRVHLRSIKAMADSALEYAEKLKNEGP